MAGAAFIISGYFELMADSYRLRIQALEVETTTIKYSFTNNILNTQQVKALMSETGIVDFTVPERAGAAVGNLVFGLGSFLQKDFVGGGITAGAEALGTVLTLTAIFNHNGYWHTYSLLECQEDTPPFLIGIAAYAGGAIFGIVRAMIFHKPGSTPTKAATATAPFNFGLVPDKEGNIAAQMSYTLRF
jgi:hypothetical protein